jgi:hypothetical protein
MRHRLAYLTALLTLALLGAAVQSSLAFAASPGWVDAETLSSPGRAEGVRTAIDADGDALAVWRSNGLMFSTRSPGDGGWSAPEQISTETQIGSATLAVNATGEAVIAWVGFAGTAAVHTVTRDAAGSFSAETTISPPGEGPGALGVAIDFSGDAVVTWTTQEGPPAVRVATRPAGGEFTLADAIPVSGEFGLETTAAIVGKGEVILTWTERDGEDIIVKAATGSIGATAFSATVELAGAGSEAFELGIAVDADGDAVVVWTFNEGSSWSIHSVARSGADGHFSSPVQISSGNGQEDSPRVAMAANGAATIVWSAGLPEQAVESASWSPADGYSDVQQLSAPGAEGTEPAVASNASGDTLVSWGANGSVQAAAKPSGAVEFGAPVTISPPGSVQAPAGTIAPDNTSPLGRVRAPAVAIAPDGNGVSAWTYTAPRVGNSGAKSPHTNAPLPDGVIQAAGFDTTPPLLTDVVIPATGKVGQPLSFSAQPVDNWTREPATEFSFGDGGSASGTAVSHTYGAPGTYSVTVTATDARGFAATEHGSIKIEAAAATNTKEKPKDDLTTTAKPRAKVAIAIKTPQALPISGGAVVLKIENKGNRAVSGTLNLWTTAHLKVEMPASVGAQDYSVKPGKTATVTVALSDEALHLIDSKASHRLAVKAAASYKAASGKGGKASRKVKLQG